MTAAAVPPFLPLESFVTMLVVVVVVDVVDEPEPDGNGATVEILPGQSPSPGAQSVGPAHALPLCTGSVVSL